MREPPPGLEGYDVNTVQTPEVSIQTTPEAVTVEPSAHVSHGGGSSRPGWCESPAKVGATSAQTSSSEPKNLLMASPVVEVVERDGRVPAVTVHSTPSDADLVLFRSLADRKDFDELSRLCLERLTVARDESVTLRWRKDFSIVLALQSRFTDAHTVLKESHWLAERVEGATRDKYENEFGIVLARLGRSSLALDHFGRAYQGHRRAGSLAACAQVDHNRARALITRGEHAKAMRYIRRALAYARANNDFRLEGEICESVLEFELESDAKRLREMLAEGGR